MSRADDDVARQRARIGPRQPAGRSRERTTPEWDRFVASLPEPLAALHVAPPADVLPLPGGREVTFGELVAVLRDQTAPPGISGPSSVRNNAEGAAWVAVAWRHTVHGQVRAVLALLDAGLDAEAQANARSALEHAVELVRLAAAADAGGLKAFMDALERDLRERQRKQLLRLAQIDDEGGGVHRELVEHAMAAVAVAPGPKPAGPKTVKDRFAAAGPWGPRFHDVYGRLSEATHAGMTSAAGYMSSVLKHGGPMPARPVPTAWAETLAVLSWSCWAADDALLRFVDGSQAAAARHARLMGSVGLNIG